MFLEPKKKREMFMYLLILYHLLKDVFCCTNMLRLRLIVMPFCDRFTWDGMRTRRTLREKVDCKHSRI